jgi:hypothetical protein
MWNVMSLVTDSRCDEVLNGLKRERFTVAALVGTRMRLSTHADGFDVILRSGCIIVSFGHRGDHHAGCAIVLNASIFKLADVVRVWCPPDPSVLGRVGFVRLKRKNFDFSITVAYPPPIDANNTVRDAVHKVYSAVEFTLTSKHLAPNRCTPLLALDANGHVGLSRDKATRAWEPTITTAIGTFDAEHENTQGRVFREFLERHDYVALNSFFPTGKTYYSQTGSETRIDFVCAPRRMLTATRCDATIIMEWLGDVCQYIKKTAALTTFPWGWPSTSRSTTARRTNLYK